MPIHYSAHGWKKAYNPTTGNYEIQLRENLAVALGDTRVLSFGALKDLANRATFDPVTNTLNEELKTSQSLTDYLTADGDIKADTPVWELPAGYDIQFDYGVDWSGLVLPASSNGELMIKRNMNPAVLTTRAYYVVDGRWFYTEFV